MEPWRAVGYVVLVILAIFALILLFRLVGAA